MSETVVNPSTEIRIITPMLRRRLAPPELTDQARSTALADSAAAEPSPFDHCVRSAPAAQNAIDLFAGSWASSLPAVLNLDAGSLPLFDDLRIKKVLAHLDSIKSFKVLELGPYEGGHTHMLHEGGARIIAIEGNAESFLKCLVVKEILNLNRAHFFLGDFNVYLDDPHDHFDLVLASGVLYESAAPLELLESIARVTDKVAIWTHYWEGESITSDPNLAACFGDHVVTTTWRDRTLHLHPNGRDDPLARPTFCDDPNGRAMWLERDELLAVLSDLGFQRITVLDDDARHPKGPALLVCAER